MKTVHIFRLNGATQVVSFDSEKWRVFKDFYLIGINGEVKSLRTMRLIEQDYNTKGYKRVTVEGKRYLTHRLVMLVYKGDSELEVDHLNGIKDDNRLENLEYVTSKENTRRARTRKGWGVASTSTEDCPF
jgi:hypothetical protein